MTTRDPPRSRNPRPAPGAAREPTQSLSIPADEVADHLREPSHPSLALGTHGAPAAERDERTKVESPLARGKTPAPPQPQQLRNATRPPPAPRNPDDPQNRVGSVLGSYRLGELLGKGGMG